MVYRPVAISKRRLVEVVKYNDGKADLRPRARIDEMRYKEHYQRIKCFDCVDYKAFFQEYAWDAVKIRMLHRPTRLKPGMYVKRTWLDSRNVPSPLKFRRIKQAFLMQLADMLMDDMVEEMVESGNRLTFTVLDPSNHILGGYKIGVFLDKSFYSFNEKLILAIVPHNIERVGKFYPIIHESPKLREKLDKAYQNKVIHYEDIDIQERLAAHNRLSGLYRRVR